MKAFSLKDNLFTYIISMRWYCAFISGMAGWLSLAFSQTTPHISKQLVVLGVLFIGWGANQVINDYLGLAEDRHNAPKRPMVTGKLDIRFALTLSTILFLIGLIATALISKQAIIFYLLMFSLNIIYERAKRIPLLGNIFFGLLIASCVYYAASSVSEKTLKSLLLDSRIATLAILVWLINFVLCFFSDFKDYDGDKKAKVRTLVVLLGIDKAKYLGPLLSIIPFIYLYFVLKMSLISFYCPPVSFFIMLALTLLCLLYPAILLIKYPQGENTYYSLKWVITGTVLFKTTLIGLINPALSITLFLLSIIFIKLLFGLYKDYPV